jgi:tripartite-type tricarboxylate transporter receptor subunit TctC
MQRRSMILGAAALALSGVQSIAAAETFPSKPIKLIVPWPSGGAADFVARLVAEGMRKDLGQTVIVDNKPGATGLIGINATRSSPADGYTLVLAISNTHGLAPALNPKLAYDPVRDFTPIGVAAIGPLAVTVHPSVPVKTLPELVDYAKKNPGKLSFASAGPGSASHLLGEMLKSLAGINIVHVPYKGAGQAVQDLVAGRVHILFDGVAVKPYLQDGRLRALATTGPQRWSALPDTPTTAEAGYPKLRTVGWFGIMGPKDMPQPIVDRLNRSLQLALKDPALQSALKIQGMDIPTATSPAEMTTFIGSEIDRWKQNLKMINYTPTE